MLVLIERKIDEKETDYRLIQTRNTKRLTWTSQNQRGGTQITQKAQIYTNKTNFYVCFYVL